MAPVSGADLTACRQENAEASKNLYRRKTAPTYWFAGVFARQRNLSRKERKGRIDIFNTPRTSSASPRLRVRFFWALRSYPGGLRAPARLSYLLQARNYKLRFLQYSAPAAPRSSSAHVDGSGTPEPGSG